jgi:hypothetical protein
MTKTCQLIGTLALLASLAPASAQSFDFNSGSDAGLTHYSPLTPFGAGGSFSFPGGDSYRIQAPSSPAPGSVGPARAGSYLATSFTQFTESVDIVGWNNSLGQAFGLIGRIQNPGLGTSSGYGLVVFPSGVIAINRFDHEQATGITGTAFAINPADSYRLVFNGNGSTLNGTIYDLSNLATPLATLSTVDTHYTSGFGGMIAAASIQTPSSAADATFDNFTITSVPEPAEYALVAGLSLVGIVAWRRRSSK